MNKLKQELKQLKIQIRVGIDQKQISQDWGIFLLSTLEEAINYTHSCESDSEQLHTEVFNLANKLAINGYGNEAVKMHGICNGM